MIRARKSYVLLPGTWTWFKSVRDINLIMEVGDLYLMTLDMLGSCGWRTPILVSLDNYQRPLG